jgi:arabinofuranosyltransferase
MKNLSKYLPLVLILPLAWVIVRSAWINDDAYITFRSIENFLAGYGPVYNLGERVQTFTHPLWFFVQAAVNAVTQRIGALNAWAQTYYVSLFLSMAFSLAAAILLLVGVARSLKGAVLAGLVLLLSKAFIDYTTSGLENALGYFLLVLFIWIFLSERVFNHGKVFALSLVAGLAVLNRMDTILLFLPALVYAVWQSPGRGRAFGLVLAGFAPFFLWELFSIFYYGFPFPNTAYAKLNTGIARLDLIRQGLYYILDSLHLDTLTLLAVAGCLVWSFWKGTAQVRLLALGVCLYLAYTTWIGGDFMSGRFYSLPLLACTALVSTWKFPNNWVYAVVLAGTLLVGMINPHSPLRTRLDFGPVDPEVGIVNGITDERLFYYHRLGWLSTARADKGKAPPGSRFGGFKWVAGGESPEKVEVVGPLGVAGYQAGPDVHMLDYNSLADPLMPRLPLAFVGHWRIGHFHHLIPPGYLATLETGENLIQDPALAEYYDRLALVTRGPLLDPQRWREILRLNTGYYNDLLDTFENNWIAAGRPSDQP